jgi:hypothetical protein
MTDRTVVDAWRELGDVGLKSEHGLREAWELVKASDYHAEQLANEVNRVVKAAGEWACSIEWGVVDGEGERREAVFDDAALRRFQGAVASEVSAAAAAYLLRGILVGLYAGTKLSEGE